KPAAPVMPVEWVDTDAQNAGCEITQVEVEGKSTVRIRKRNHLLDQMAKARVYGKHTSPPLITERQAKAGNALHDAWCENMRSGGPIKEYVQSSPDWGSIALANVERIWKFTDVTKYLPSQHRDVVLQVCNVQIPTDDLKGLRLGLDAIADGLGL
ncbi:MAG: hypothetical protein AB8B85_16810, partial [Paracoccaceae bacterium]